MLPEDHAPPALRVAILFYEKGDEAHDLHIRFQNKLKAAGHTVVHAPKNLVELGGNTRRLARMIKDTDADAWVVLTGSVGVLKYFEQQQVPVFALYGALGRVKIAGIGPDQTPVIAVSYTHLRAHETYLLI